MYWLPIKMIIFWVWVKFIIKILFLFTFKKFKIIFQLDRNIGLEHSSSLFKSEFYQEKEDILSLNFEEMLMKGQFTEVWAG